MSWHTERNMGFKMITIAQAEEYKSNMTRETPMKGVK